MEIVKLLIVVGLLVIATQFRGIFVKENVAIRTAHVNGFTEIKVVDKVWFLPALRGCSEKDAVRFTVRAKNFKGEEVEFYVCSGWLFKAATVRVP